MLIEDRGYVHRIEDLQFLPGVIEGLKRLGEDFLFFIITDHSGIDRYQGIEIEQTYFCPHVDGCDCKKPSTKYIDEAIRLYGIESTKSWTIGDHSFDVVMGKNAGHNTVYLLTGHGRKHLRELEEKEVEPTIIADNFLSAVEFILRAPTTQTAI